jgi:hypothetical protein
VLQNHNLFNAKTVNKNRKIGQIKEEKWTGLCAPGKAWSLGIDGASRHEMA